jgi:hypothetical protein
MDYLIGEADKNAKLIHVYKVGSTEDQQPEGLDKLSFTVCDCCV